MTLVTPVHSLWMWHTYMCTCTSSASLFFAPKKPMVVYITFVCLYMYVYTPIHVRTLLYYIVSTVFAQIKAPMNRRRSRLETGGIPGSQVK